MTARLAGKVALVSGAARGMGASHAREMVAHGARVVCGDILDAEGERVAEDLGDAARYVHLDVTSPHDWERAVAVALAAILGGLVTENALLRAFVEDPATWTRALVQNLLA